MVTFDAGLMVYRELDNALGLTAMAGETLADTRTSKNSRYVVFQMAKVAIPLQTFHEILRLIAELRPQPLPAPA